MCALVTSNLLGQNPAQAALNAKINPSPLQNPTSGGSLTPAFNALSTNTKPFNPATVGQFNTTPSSTVNFGAVQPGNIQSSGTTGLGGLVSLPKPVPQNNAIQTAPVSTTGSTSGGATGSAPAAYTPTGTTPTQPPAPLVSLPGITGALTNSALTGSSAATGYNAGTAAAANTNPAIAANANTIAANYAALANPYALAATNDALGHATGNGSEPVGGGIASAITSAEGSYLSGLSAQEGQQLSANAQGLTAAQQQAQGLNNATQNALTAQGQTQSGLTSAGGLASPSVGAAGQSFYNPETQTSSGNQYGSGPAAAANVAEIQSQTQQVDEYSAAKSEVSNIVQGSLNPLLSQYNINPSNINQVNSWIQSIAGQTSTPQYQQLSNIMTDLAARYAQILTPAGGSQTDTSRLIATGLLNPSAQGSTFSQVIAGLDAQASQVISGLQSNINTLNNGGNPNTGSGTPVSAGGYNFVQNSQGQWVAK